MKNWIIVANQIEARLFSVSKGNDKLNHIKTITNEYESKDSETTPGRTLGATSGTGTRNLVKENKHEFKIYTQAIVDYLNSNHNDYSKVMIVAGPNIMGELTPVLERNNVDIFKRITKDYANLKEHELYPLLKEDIIQSFPI